MVACLADICKMLNYTTDQCENQRAHLSVGGLFSVIAFFLYLGASYTAFQYYHEVVATPVEERPSNDDDYTFSEQTESHHPESPEPHARPHGRRGRKHKKSSEASPLVARHHHVPKLVVENDNVDDEEEEEEFVDPAV